MSRSNELIFCMLEQIQESQKLFQWFLGEHGEKWPWPFSLWYLVSLWNSAVSKERVYESSWFFAFWLWKSNFLVRHTSYSIYLTFKSQCTAFVLVGTLEVAKRVLWNRIFCPSLYVGLFFGNWIVRFLWISAWY